MAIVAPEGWPRQQGTNQRLRMFDALAALERANDLDAAAIE
jgi:hypothetical protein